MPTDFAVYYLTHPLGLIIQAALLVVPLLMLRFIFPNAFAPVGFRRLFFGHLAVAAGVYLISIYSAYSIATHKVEAGHIQQSEFYGWIAGNSVYLFVLTYLFALLFVSFVLAPLCVWLFRSGRATLVTYAALGIVVALVLSALSVAFPANDWGRTHPMELFASTLASIGLGVVIASVCFAAGARLPLKRQLASKDLSLK